MEEPRSKIQRSMVTFTSLYSNIHTYLHTITRASPAAPAKPVNAPRPPGTGFVVAAKAPVKVALPPPKPAARPPPPPPPKVAPRPGTGTTKKPASDDDDDDKPKGGFFGLFGGAKK